MFLGSMTCINVRNYVSSFSATRHRKPKGTESFDLFCYGLFSMESDPFDSLLWFIFNGV
jgi:hypothetical protein